MRIRRVDVPILAVITLLTVIGFFIFTSASFKLFSSITSRTFFTTILNQFIFGIVAGGIGMYVCARTSYHIWKKYALILFLVSIATTLLVFVPGIGITAGGAQRWLGIGVFSFQPSELLKLATIVYVASLLSSSKEKNESIVKGVLPVLLILGAVGAVLLAQPDTDTFLFIAVASLGIFISAGGRWLHLFAVGLIGCILLFGLIEARPYLKNRINAFLHPTPENSLGSQYQIEQALIAIGSGGVAGKGFGQSVQKFGYLPEPTTDSIFAVAAEEFGFIGSSSIVILFSIFGIRGLSVARKIPFIFGRNLMVGIILLILTGSFINIAALTGIIPLAGTPLLFISHGGTALFFTLVSCGIVLNISRTRKS